MKTSSVKINVGPILVGWTNLTTMKVAFLVIPFKSAKLQTKLIAHLLVEIYKKHTDNREVESSLKLFYNTHFF